MESIGCIREIDVSEKSSKKVNPCKEKLTFGGSFTGWMFTPSVSIKLRPIISVAFIEIKDSPFLSLIDSR